MGMPLQAAGRGRPRTAAGELGSRSIARAWAVAVAVRTGRSRACQWALWCPAGGIRRKHRPVGRRRAGSRCRPVAVAVAGAHQNWGGSRVAAALGRRSSRCLTSLVFEGLLSRVQLAVVEGQTKSAGYGLYLPDLSSPISGVSGANSPHHGR